MKKSLPGFSQIWWVPWDTQVLWATEMGTHVFCLPNGDIQLQCLPYETFFSNTENSHKCQRPYFFNIKIKGKVSVIPMHLLSKYTAIRVSYGAWQGLQTTLRFCLFHSWRPWEFLALSFLFSQLCPGTCSKSNWKGLTESQAFIFSSRARMFRI